MRVFFATIVGLVVITAGHALAGTVPQEPEEDNQEYLLDWVTNEYSRWWREVWDAGDNRFRFRMGSNNVAQWFVDEELKFATTLSSRLRFRFYHARKYHYTTDKVKWDVLELEGRVYDRHFLSFYVRPTFDKRTSSLGFMYQHRREVNQFIKLSVEWPGFMRNFSERRRYTSDSLLSVFTNQPVRFAIDVREKIVPSIWIRARGELIPTFEMGDEIDDVGTQFPRERAEAAMLAGWVEYIWDPSRDLREQTAFGLDAGYERSNKSKDLACGCVSWEDFGHGVAFRGGEPFSGNASNGSGAGVQDRDDPLRRVPETRFGDDLFEQTDNDAVKAWRDTRWFLSPYAWVVVNDRVTLRSSIRYDEREIAIGNDKEQTFYTTNKYIVPLFGVRYAFGESRRAILETGFASEFRKRTEERVDRPGDRVTASSERFDDHRLYVAFEYAFSDSKVIRLNEAIELDPEDRGEFRIHDHGFFQLIISF